MKRKFRAALALVLALAMCISQPTLIYATESGGVEEAAEDSLDDDSVDVIVAEDAADIQEEESEDTGVDIAAEGDIAAEAEVDDEADIVSESLTDDVETLIEVGEGQESLSATVAEVGISLTSEEDESEDITTSESTSDTEEDDNDATDTSSIPDDVCVFNGHSYKLYTSASSYEDAMAKCEELGGHLATITSAEEDEYLYAMVTGQGYLSAYFGLLKTDDGSWVWVNGEEVSYTNWGEDEPNNEDGDEFYGQYHYSDTTGGWNDANWGDGGTAYICEWDYFSIPSDVYTLNGHSYKLYSYASSYSDAMTECIERGGHLATISSAEEDEFLYNMIREQGYLSAYFGLIKVSDNWAWVTLEDITYTNWGEGEPNNDDGDEVYGQYHYTNTTGGWNDANWGDGSTAYICEWDNEEETDKDIDYTWNFGVDNFSFTNSYSAFGFASYYIEDEMLNAYLETLTNTEIAAIATHMTMTFDIKSMSILSDVESKVDALWNNHLKMFGGSCYGMSLLSLLIKMGYVDAEEMGASTTYELGPLTFSENTDLESLINIYQISQYVETHNSSVAKEYDEDKAKEGDEEEDYGDENFAEAMEKLCKLAEVEPFIMYLAKDRDENAHSVVCFGIETGDFDDITRGSLFNKRSYSCDKRLLIYNPNLSELDYVYISSDFSKAELASDSSYNTFGITISDRGYLGSSYYTNLDIPHYIYLYVNDQTSASYSITDSDGEYVVITDKTIVEGPLEISISGIAATLANGEESSNDDGFYMVGLPDTSEYYTLTALDDGSFDVLLSYDDFAVNLSGIFESATVHENGQVDIINAEGSLIVDIILNNSEFDYVSVTGEADGDVYLQITDENITIAGELTNYVVVNMDNDCNYTAVYVEGDTDVQATMKNEEVTLYTDADEDGVYESLLSHAHHYIYEDNGDGTHTATCIGGDDTYTEAHTYVDGACEYCGAEEPVAVVSSGTCGENLTWTVDENGTITISGTGDMENYDAASQIWSEYAETVTSVLIEDGVTGIGDYAFYNLTALESVTIPESVATIGNHAFDGDASLTDVYYAGSESSWELITIGDNNDSLTAAEIHYGSSGETGGDTGDSGESGGSGETGDGRGTDEGSGSGTGTDTGSGAEDSGTDTGSGSTDTSGTASGTDSSSAAESTTDSTESTDTSVTTQSTDSGTDSSVTTAETTASVENVESADTGDGSMVFLLLTLVIISGTALLTINMTQRKHRNHN